jgi:integrase/recombinase XerD
MTAVRWECFPLVAQSPLARSWLALQANLGRSPNTITAYGRGVEDYLRFCDARAVEWPTATREHIGHYVQDLRTRINERPTRAYRARDGIVPGLSNATVQQRLTAVRLLYDHLLEDAVRPDNPFGRGRYTPHQGFGSNSARGLVPTVHKLPWIPTEVQWRAILEVARGERLRNRFMLALAYDAALRREELCLLATGDMDPTYRLLRIRAETTKSRRERVVPYSLATGRLYEAYLAERCTQSRSRGPLFLSESPRNRTAPITFWTWSKVVAHLGQAAGVPALTTHTLRHLCLTDLARAGWDIHEIALFAGHRNPQTTLRYIHLSGRELQAKIERGLAALHDWRGQLTGDLLT